MELTAQLIDSSPFAKKYTSGCLSFYEHDLNDQDKQQIMQNFEQCLFPALDPDQYQILWVQHQDKVNQDTGETRLELNFVIPNVELSTGKRLQPFYAPVDLDRVDLFKQITNTEHSLYDPDDPEHRQLFLNKKNLPKDVKDFKEQLHQRIYRAVANGDVADRQELVKWLESNQITVTRQTSKSISIENPYEDAKRPIRLNGEIYEQSFRATGEYRQEVQQRITEYRGTTGERYRTNVTDYQRQLEHKSQYYSDRYSTVGRENCPEHSRQCPDSRETARSIPSLATIEIESFNAIERADTDPRTANPKSSYTEKLTILNVGLISAVVILLIAIFSFGLVTKNKYSEMQTLNTVINEKQMRVDHLNRSGGSMNISTCKNLSNNKQRLCIQINKNAGEWQNGYMIPMGY